MVCPGANVCPWLRAGLFTCSRAVLWFFLGLISVIRTVRGAAPEMLAALLVATAGSKALAPAPCEYLDGFIAPPCVWPSHPAAGLPFAPSTALLGLTVLENATKIENYGADTWYPAEDRHGNLYSGFDDGMVDQVSVGSACTRPRAKCITGKYGYHTGSAVVSGSSWKNLSVKAPGGAIFEDGFPMQGRYTCANAVANGTWWVGSYGLAVGDGSCAMGTGVLQFCEMGPFVGFRSSTDGGATWREPRDPKTAEILNVSHPLFDETAGLPIKLGGTSFFTFPCAVSKSFFCLMALSFPLIFIFFLFVLG